MSDITLSAAVRSNLLSLQNTASLLDTTQTDLATGNKVNSALDNPTSYFTASALNSRASDLGNLLDSVSNATQTIQAANDGITSITKLVESAQATANQAQQLSETIDTPATAGSYTGGSFTTLNVSGTATSPSAGTLTEGTFGANVDVHGTGSSPTAAADITGSGFAALDVSTGSVGFTLSVDGTSQSISIDSAAVTAFTTAGGTIAGSASALTVADVAKIVDYQFNNADTTGTGPVTVSGGQLQVASSTTGASSNVTISGLAAAGGATDTTGLANANHSGADAVPADQLSFSLNVDGSGAQTININAATVAATPGGLNAASLSASDIAAVINHQVGSTVATVASGKLVFTSGTTGGSSSVAVGAVTATGSATDTTGITAGSNTGSAGTSADSVSFGVAIDGGSATTVTIDAAHVTAYNSAHATSLSASSLSASDVANIVNGELGSSVATASGGKLVFASLTTGASSSVAISGYSASVTGGSTGIANSAGTDGTAASTSANPARSALISQYNGLLDQIDQLTADAGYNGNNLLAGSSTQLKVVFNETGTSSLTITGADASSTGLGLSQLGSTAFDTNASITSILSSLKTATDTLRSDASSFGSNLSVVQTRQDFTKSLINTLQTGASNLTLADSNEEAADLLALQTRQQLSTKALSLASQSDQNVLRLLQ